jgi:DNA polymerase-1
MPYNKKSDRIDLMVIGENPSIEEELSGNILDGTASKLLRDSLAKHGVTDFYFTNLVKCRCEIELTKEYIEACRKHLIEEIKFYQPKVILTLGNNVLKSLTRHSGISTYRGHEIKLGESTLIPTYSPSAVLRSPKYGNEFEADIIKACMKVKGTVSKFEPKIRYVMTVQDLKDLLLHLKEATSIVGNWGGLDLETTTFDYWRPETKILTMGICVDDNITWGIPIAHKDSPWRNQVPKLMSYIGPYLNPDNGFYYSGNNYKYDQKWIHAKTDWHVNFKRDNMLMGYASDENIPHGLEYQAQVWLHCPKYKDIPWPKFDPVTDDIKKVVAKYDMLDLKKLLKYQAIDAYNSRQIRPLEEAKLRTDPRSWNIYEYLLEQGSVVFTEIEENGMWVDPDRLAKAADETDRHIEEVTAKLNALIPPGWIERNLSPKVAKKGFNWNSTKQLGQLLFQKDGFDFPILLQTDSGAPSTAESVIIELGSEIDHPVLTLLLEYRKWSKYKSTYLQPWAAKMDANNCIHPNFKLHGTVTGRLSGEDGVHQVPRDKFIRGLIGAPPGWSFFEIDGSQIELRVVADVSKEPTMLYIYSIGGDIHRTTAASVAGKLEEDVTGDERKKAKAVNFGFVYGMGWKKFKIYAWEKYGVRLTDAEAKLYRERFFQKYDGLPDWHKRTKELVRQIGYVISPIGRKRRLPNIYSSDSDMRAAAEREAVNSPVQGFGSDYVLAGFIEMVLERAPAIDPNWRESLKPVGSVHDAQYYLIRNDMLDFWPTKIKECFDDPGRLQRWFNYTPSLPITGDCKIGTHWGDAKDWNIGEEMPFTPR